MADGPPAETFPALVRHNAARCGDRPAVVTIDSAITHGALDERSRALAARFVAAGVGPHCRVGLLAPNGIDWAVTAAAVLRIGGVLVPLSTLLRPSELEAQLRTAGVTHLVAVTAFRGRHHLDDVEAIAPGIAATTAACGRHATLPNLRAVWDLDDLPTAAVDPALVDALGATVRPADDLAVLFTSGSRGTPKGVVHTHGGGLRAVAAGLDARCLHAGDRLYVPMPFFWTGGFSTGLLSVIVAGATLLTEAIPEPDQTLTLLERERVTLFRGWPDQATRLAAHPRFADADLSSLGDGSLPAVLPADRRPAPGARANIFGMTETFGPYCGARLDLDLPTEARGSCGRPFDGVEVAISEADTGAPVAAGMDGEIRVRGQNVMRTICGRTRDEVFDRDARYRTGDLGALDADGWLWYRGRLDDMFKVKGATVYPAEVEAALRSVDGVRQAHVTDVATDDGAVEVGALVLSDADAGVSPGDIAAGAKARLSAFKVPTRWVMATDGADVPRTATDKVDKAALQALLRKEGTQA